MTNSNDDIQPTPAEKAPAPPTIEEQLDSLPTRPGVYLMKDADDRVIYVGKALNLRTRVRSYFRESGDGRANVAFLRGRVANLETVVTATEKEALLLENLLIKKHQPRYNIRLRDDKTYISLRLDVEHEWPRLHRVRRRREGDRAEYFGPFSSSKAVKETMRFLQKLFPLRSCPDQVLRNRTRPCVLHQIDRCCAPCVGRVEPHKYQEYVDQTKLFLRGRREEVIELLRAKMWEYSEAMLYEKAAEVRDSLQAIERTMEAEVVASHRTFTRDVIGLARERGRMAFTVLQFRRGNLDETQTYDLKDPGLDDAAVMEDFIGQYYDGGREVPRDVLVSVEPANGEMVRRIVEELRGGPVRLAVPQRGEKTRLVQMAVGNARQELERRLAGEKSREQVLQNLQNKLKIANHPRRIECFDISNFQGSFNVGSMTCFIDGQPDKSQYRRFKIRTIEGQNDFAAMREVLTRRYGRALREKTELPDLIVIDGGKGQLNIAIEVLRELGLLGRVPVCGLAKARLKPLRGGGVETDKTRTEERIFLPNRKDAVRFDQSDPALFVLTRIRDEAHRFGVEYHRKLRGRANLRTGLEDLPGVGPKRRRLLITHFGSLARLRAASPEDIAAVPGIPTKLAREIHQFLHASPTPAAADAALSVEDTDGEWLDQDDAAVVEAADAEDEDPAEEQDEDIQPEED